MPFDLGTIAIIVAALIFYLRLILIQRERARRLRRPTPAAIRGKPGKKAQAENATQQLSILSQNPRDWIIAGGGVVLVIVGVLLYSGMIQATGLRAYWWIPVATGIVAFSWAFR